MPRPRTLRFDNVNDWFWGRVDRTGDCWLYTRGSVQLRTGHRRTRMDGRAYGAHVIGWMTANGPVPEGLWILHRCNNPPCVRPDHLYAGTAKDNVADMIAAGRVWPRGVQTANSLKAHCPKGHEYTPENTYVPPKRLAVRECRTCRKVRLRLFKIRQRGSSR